LGTTALLCPASTMSVFASLGSAVQTAIRLRLDMIVSVLLLPLFFALTGMRTRLDLLSDINTWLWAALVLAAALGKWARHHSCTLERRFLEGRVALGALLNTRGW